MTTCGEKGGGKGGVIGLRCRNDQKRRREESFHPSSNGVEHGGGADSGRVGWGKRITGRRSR